MLDMLEYTGSIEIHHSMSDNCISCRNKHILAISYSMYTSNFIHIFYYAGYIDKTALR